MLLEVFGRRFFSKHGTTIRGFRCWRELPNFNFFGGATRQNVQKNTKKRVLADIHGIVNGGFLKWWYLQTIHFNRVFHYKPSILGYPYFWKHPNRCIVRCFYPIRWSVFVLYPNCCIGSVFPPFKIPIFNCYLIHLLFFQDVFHFTLPQIVLF